jgi:hypothetical protein
MSVEQVSKVASVLASYVTEATVSSAIARYGDVGEHLLAFAVALEIGLPALTTLQVAQLANKKKEVNELRSVIRRQEARLRDYASTDFSGAHESTRVEESSLVEVDVNLTNETSAILNVSSGSDDD